MEPPFDFESDALDILTQAAMHTQPSDSSPSRFSPPQRSTRLTPTTSSSDDILNNVNGNTVLRASNLLQPLSPDPLNEYNLSARNMVAMAYSQSHGGKPMSYMNQGPGYRGIGSQISQNYANSLGILNADSYDDGRGALRAQEQVNMRIRHNPPTMPFGITSGPKINMGHEVKFESQELDAGSRKRKKPGIEPPSEDEDEEAGRKARGRPRVDTKDETAADRRRTQIRMAQRAYRNRKETTIASLEKQVQTLKGANEEMSNIFSSLYDFAVGKGLLDREPDFGRQLQSTFERFVVLAKLSEDPEDGKAVEGEKHEDSGDGKRKPKRRYASPNKVKEATPLVSEPPENPWGGYTLSKEESSIEEIDLGYQPDEQYRQIITRPTEDNASFPFDLVDLQQYRVEIPEMQDFPQNFFQSQLPLPNSHSYHEFSFARRIHRGSLERAFRLIRSDQSSVRFKQVFGFSLLYENREGIEARLRRLLSGSSKDTLQNWRAPFVHIGGAGTYYPLHGSDINGDLMPKFRTGYSMGPFQQPIAQVQELLDEDMKCNLPGFEGEFFDSTDVEGYLRGRGLDIAPAADFVTGEVDLNVLVEMPSPNGPGSDTVSSILSASPQTPRSPTGDLILVSEYGRTDGTMTISKTLNDMAPNIPFAYNNYDNPDQKVNQFINPNFSAGIGSNMMIPESQNIVISDGCFGEKRTVTLNVKTLLDEILGRAVCLGRAPGFRPSDVNAAIIAAVVKDGF